MWAVQPSFRNVAAAAPLVRLAVKATTVTTTNTNTNTNTNTLCRILHPCRTYSSSQPPPAPREAILDMESFQTSLAQHAPSITQSLLDDGYYCTPHPYSILPRSTIQTMRHQSIHLRQIGRFEPSWSEKIDVSTGQATRFDKEGVFACEPDGRDYDIAPDLITYMSVLLQTLPELLNRSSSSSLSSSKSNHLDEEHEQPSSSSSFHLSATSFNAKLAVTSPGGSVYPLHIDNPQGLSVGDTRKLTCILYLNPDYQPGDGGELRIYHPENGPQSSSSSRNETTTTTKEEDDDDGTVIAAPSDECHYIDLTPEGGKMVLFWSDEIPHEVLPTAPDVDDPHNNNVSEDNTSSLLLDRYALTVWIPTENLQSLHNPQSKFATLGDTTFP